MSDRKPAEAERQARPSLSVHLVRQGLGGRGFTPLATPVSFDLERDGVDPDLIRRLHCRFRLELVPGRSEVPLISGQAFPVDVPEGCVGRGWVSAERSEDGDARITSAGLSFDPPMMLHNILPVLARLNRVFQDREVTELLGRLGGMARAGQGAEGVRQLGKALGRRVRPRLDRVLPPGTSGREALHELRESLRVGSERAAQVRLRHVSARPVFRAGCWQLDLRFTGFFDVLGRAPVAFEDVHVPHLVIPYPYASLARLVSGEPLATAALRSDNIPVRALASSMAGVLAGLSGQLDLVVDLPEIHLHAELPDGGTLVSELSPPRPAHLRAGFEGLVHGSELQLSADQIELELEGGRVELELRGELRLAEPPAAGEPGLMEVLAGAAVDGGWPEDALRLSVRGSILEGSSLQRLDLRLGYRQPALRGGVDVAGSLREVELRGCGALELDPATGTGQTQELDVTFSSGLRLDEGSHLDDGTTVLRIHSFEGAATGRVQASSAEDLRVELRSEAGFDLGGATSVGMFPELDIDEGELLSVVRGRVALAGAVSTSRAELLSLDFGGTTMDVALDHVELELGERSLRLPSGSTVHAELLEARLDSSGLGRSRVGVRYDLQGGSPVLMAREGEPVELFVSELRQGELELSVGALGDLSIAGPEGGLYDARYFNALVNPDQELERVFELLQSDDALDKIIAALRVFSNEVADLAEQLRRFARRVDAALRAEGIDEPADAIPGHKMARLLSRILVESPELEGRIHPLVKQVTDGLGLDIIATKRLLDDTLPPHDYGFEVDRVVRWLAGVLGPTEPPGRIPLRELPSLAEQPTWVARFASLPTAAEIYLRVGSGEPLTPEFQRGLARVAPYLSFEQLDWLSRTEHDWIEPVGVRLGLVRALKQRVRGIAERYGGLGFAPQGIAISMFLAPTVAHAPPPEGRIPAIAGEPEGLLAHPDCLMGPHDVAVLLQAGLAAPLQGRVVQRNQRLLLDLCLDQPPAFLRQVLVEMCQGSARILAAELMALLDLEQGAMREPLDLVGVFRERLEVRVPRLEDFLAGGRRARHSYYGALNDVAETILADAEPYLALRERLRSRRAVVPPQPAAPRDLEREARRAIREADKLGRQCRFEGRRNAAHANAEAAYVEAFEACAALLRAEPRSFQLPWLRSFQARNFEALQVLSVTRNAQQRVDRVREWLVARSGRSLPRSEQRLLETVIDALYVYPEDQRALKRDPLVRLLIDPPPGRYDFTVVTAMGVVTEGARGRELEDAFRRLEEQRGVRLVRADTATARSLDFNAKRIEEAVREVQTPWGWLGYSQGCANGFWAESMLMAGTPEQQELLRGLRCRHLLFSAANGSAHGTCGDLKFRRAMVDGDNFLSHYQSVFSREAIKLALRALRTSMDSPMAIKTMGGVESLSWEGVISLGREAQIVDTAPTTSMRGVVREPYLPEALEFLAHVLTVQTESAEHDTQVSVEQALGHPIHVSNAWCRRMEACDVGSRPQATHHWSPLLYATEFVTTERDIERCIYDFPKDRHIFPWIELNARFGIIGRV
jgi:hypothetical protein